MQDAGTIPKLLPFLGRTNPGALQLEALHALYNLCKISRTRQEAAAVAGAVPRLIALVASASAKASAILQAGLLCIGHFLMGMSSALTLAQEAKIQWLERLINFLANQSG